MSAIAAAVAAAAFVFVAAAVSGLALEFLLDVQQLHLMQGLAEEGNELQQLRWTRCAFVPVLVRAIAMVMGCWQEESGLGSDALLRIDGEAPGPDAPSLNGTEPSDSPSLPSLLFSRASSSSDPLLVRFAACAAAFPPCVYALLLPAGVRVSLLPALA